MNQTNPTVQAQKRYTIRFIIATVAYVVVLTATLSIVKHLPAHTPLWWALILAPLVPVGFMVPIVLTYFRETDEFERRVLTDSLAIAAGITAALSVTYGFLENAGLPHLSAWWTWIVVMGSWLIARLFVSRQYGS